MNRKHRRTRFNKICFSANNKKEAGYVKLAPGLYRIHENTDPARYVGSFIVQADHTVEFYGHNLVIEKN